MGHGENELGEWRIDRSELGPANRSSVGRVQEIQRWIKRCVEIGIDPVRENSPVPEISKKIVL